MCSLPTSREVKGRKVTNIVVALLRLNYLINSSVKNKGNNDTLLLIFRLNSNKEWLWAYFRPCVGTIYLHYSYRSHTSSVPTHYCLTIEHRPLKSHIDTIPNSLIDFFKSFFEATLLTKPSRYRKPTFHNCFYFCFPVLEIASDEHAGDINLLAGESHSYAHEMSKIAKNDSCNGKKIGNINKVILPVWLSLPLVQSK